VSSDIDKTIAPDIASTILEIMSLLEKGRKLNLAKFLKLLQVG
jgi:hypothetical protein